MVNVAITANEINIAANDLVTGANFSGTGALSITTGTSTRAIYLGGANNTNTGVMNITATELAYLVDGFSSITFGGSGYAGEISSQGNLSFKDPVVFTSTNTMTLGHDLAAASSTNASFTVGGPLTWNGGSISTGAGVVALNGDITLGGSGSRAITTTSGIITIGASTSNTVTGNSVNLTLNSGSVAINVNSALNGIGALGLGTTSQTGTITLNGVIAADSVTTGSTAYNLVFNSGSSGSTIIGTSGSSTYSLVFSNTGTLTLNDGASDTFKVLGSLTVSAPSAVNLSGNIVTAGAMTIGSALNLVSNTSLDSTADSTGISGAGLGGNITVNGSVSTANSSTLSVSAKAGNVTFANTVGGAGTNGGVVFNGNQRLYVD